MLLLYSKGVKSISEDLHITIEKAQEVYDAVLKAFPQLASWINSTQEKAQELGYVDGIYGRRRRLPDIKLPPYEFMFKIEIDNKSKKYYTDLYTKKLDSIFNQNDKQKIINDAKHKGIIIKQNGGFIAKAQRECVNSCVVYDTNIITEQYGIKPIGELVDKGGFDVFDGKAFVHCDGVICSGSKQKYIITFNDGSIMECSPLHRFLTKNTRGSTSFKTANDLLECLHSSPARPMIVCQDSYSQFNARNEQLPIFKSKAHNAVDYSLNAITDDYELGYVLGWLQGDGSVYIGKGSGNASWLVYENKYDVRDYLEKILCKYFKVTTIARSRDWHIQHGKPNATQESVQYYVYSTALAKQCDAIGIKHKIPDIVFTSSEIARGYIAGLFDTDGGFSSGSAQFTFGKAHTQENIARDLQLLLSSFGICSCVRLLSDRIRVSVRKLDNQKYGNIIGSRIDRKQHKFMTEVEMRTTTHRYSDTKRIKNIEVTDEYVPMYDVINSDTNMFVANGVVTHNCVQGSSADICKRAIIALATDPLMNKLDCKLEMSVHDENLISCPKESAYEATKRMVELSMGAVGNNFPIELKVDAEISETWYGDSLAFDENNKLIKGK